MKVFLVEDSPIIRDRLVAMVLDIPTVEVVGDADSQLEAIQEVRRQLPDVVVLDIKLREGSGVAVLEEVKHHSPGTTAIMLTNYDNQAVKQRCLELGADHFFDKTTEFEEVKRVLEQLAASHAGG